MAASLRDSTLIRMMNTGQYSDFTFSCSGEIFKVHKAVVVGQSDVIRAAVDGEFEEAKTSNIALNSYSPAIVKRLVQFLYTSEYDEPEPESHGDPPDSGTPEKDGAGVDEAMEDTQGSAEARNTSTAADLIVGHIRMNGIGDYLQIKELATRAKDKIKKLVHPDNADQSWVVHLPAISTAAVQLTADDAILRIVTRSVAENLGIVLNISNFKQSDLMTEFVLQVLTHANQIAQTLGEDLAATKQTASRTNMQLLDSRVAVAKLNAACEVLKVPGKCRNKTCSSVFGGYINDAEGSLRCRTCNCCHQPEAKKWWIMVASRAIYT